MKSTLTGLSAKRLRTDPLLSELQNHRSYLRPVSRLDHLTRFHRIVCFLVLVASWNGNPSLIFPVNSNLPPLLSWLSSFDLARPLYHLGWDLLNPFTVLRVFTTAIYLVDKKI